MVQTKKKVPPGHPEGTFFLHANTIKGATQQSFHVKPHL
jgi:hypothetical protein